MALPWTTNGSDTGTPLNIFQLWAKTERNSPDRWHGLPYHLIEVGAVAMVMWDKTIPRSRQHHLSTRLGLGDDHDLAGRFLGFIAATHDLEAAPIGVRSMCK